MSDHFILKCTCGEIISQCRCPDPNKTVRVQNGCPKCKPHQKFGQQIQPYNPAASSTRRMFVVAILYCPKCQSMAIVTPSNPDVMTCGCGEFPSVKIPVDVHQPNSYHVQQGG
jgi:hypothetical protein